MLIVGEYIWAGCQGLGTEEFLCWTNKVAFVAFCGSLKDFKWGVRSNIENLPAMQETRVWSLGPEDPLEKGMVTHSSMLAWRIPWTEEPEELQSTGLRSWTLLFHFKDDMIFDRTITIAVVCRMCWSNGRLGGIGLTRRLITMATNKLRVTKW